MLGLDLMNRFERCRGSRTCVLDVQAQESQQALGKPPASTFQEWQDFLYNLWLESIEAGPLDITHQING